MTSLALVDRLRRLPRRGRLAVYRAVGQRLGRGALATLRYDWLRWWSREDQRVTPEDVRAKLIVFTGPRGCGKTHAAVQFFCGEILAGRARRPRIIAAKSADAWGVVVHGESGIMAWLPPRQRPECIPSSPEAPCGILRFPNGVKVALFGAADAEATTAYAGDLDLYDDTAKWGPGADRAWKTARISCRAGRGLGVVATTRRGLRRLRRLMSAHTETAGERIAIKSPLAPRANAQNLTPGYFERVQAEHGGDALEDEDGGENSPFRGLDFDEPPIRLQTVAREDLEELVVAVDESGGKGPGHDLWGINVSGRRHDGHAVALEDASGSFDDAEAGEAILDACERWGALKIVVETNRGDRVLTVLRAAWYRRAHEKRLGKMLALPEIVRVVARDAKRLRAGELRPLYLDGLAGSILHHGPHPSLRLLEAQQRGWDPDAAKHPQQDDRIDAWVHAVFHLLALGTRADAWTVATDPAPDALPDPFRYVEPAPLAPTSLDAVDVRAMYEAFEGAGGDPYRYT